ncbi:MAG: hypothetical protein IID45_05445 [Planctomycetes bacterium]|nr:hypothetical protein [Planctomycetota bacterium]
MSRTRRSELEIGSDSFLDIIANIVGVLIILVVIAGVKVSRAPVIAHPPAEKTPQIHQADQQKPMPSTRQPVLIPTPTPAVLAAATPKLPRAVAKPRRLPSPELQRTIAQIERDISALDGEEQSKLVRAATISRRVAESNRNLSKAKRSLAAADQTLDRLKQQLAQWNSALANNRDALAGLRLQYDEAKRRPTKTKVIRHKLTPISRQVKGKEIHFRLSAGRLAHVPIDKLIVRLRAQVTRQKNWLIKFRRHHGQVGPIDGFVMTYAVERKQQLGYDGFGGGSSRISIVLSEWRIKPSADLVAETADAALTIGSRFYRVLRATDPKTTLTFWVYPDSFELFRTLQKFAHSEGFTVAARPLPPGGPIAGSPRGTRSARQ